MFKFRKTLLILAFALLLIAVMAGCSIAEEALLDLEKLTLTVENQNHVPSGTYSVSYEINDYDTYVSQHGITVGFSVIDEEGQIVPTTGGSFEVANDKNYRVTVVVLNKDGSVLKRSTYTVSAVLTDELSEGTGSFSSVEFFDFELNRDGETYSIIGYKYGLPEKIILPYLYQGLPVTAIGNSAFLNAKVKTVILNNSITSIGNNAFKNCIYLERINIPDSLEKIGDYAFSGCTSISGAEVSIDSKLTYIGKRAFENCTRFSNMYLPKGLLTLGEMAFYGCVNLSSLVFNFSDPEVISGKGIFTENVYTYVDPTAEGGIRTTYLFGVECKIYVNSENLGAFTNHTKWYKYADANMFEPMTLVAGDYVLKSVVSELEIVAYLGNDSEIIIPRTLELKKVVGIGEGVFRRYQAITKLVLQKELRYIGNSAFEGCSYLKEVIIEDDSYLNTIGENAFYNCTNLETLKIPETVINIGQDAFVGTKWLNNSKEEYVTVNKVLLKYNGTSATIDLTSHNEISEIAPYAFYNNLSIMRLELPSTVEKIGSNAFFGCNNLKVIIVPTTVLPSNSGARWNFYGAEKVERVEINAGTVLESKAFANASSVAAVIFREGNYLNTISSQAFLNMKALTAVTIPESVTSVASDAFLGCSALSSATVSASLLSAGTSSSIYTFFGATDIKSIDLSSGASIPAYAFSGAGKLESINVCSTVTSIGENAFKANLLAEISIPSNLLYAVTSGDWNLYGNTKVKKIIISSGTSVPAEAFKGSEVESVELPLSVTSIGENAFLGALKLRSVTVSGGTAFSSEKGVLFNGNKTSLIVFPAENAISNEITGYEIASTVTSIQPNAFYGEKTLTSITAPFIIFQNNTFSDTWSFYGGAEALNSVTVTDPNAANLSLKEEAFLNAENLISVALPGNVTAIGENAFLGCTKLKKISADSNVFLSNAAETWDFYGAENITEVNVSSGTALSSSAFSSAAKLESVKLAFTIETVGSNAFAGCSALSSISAPVNLLSENTAQSWSFFGKGNFSSFTVLAGSSTIIGTDFFKYASFTTITVGKNITEIEDGAFRECGSLTTILVDEENTRFKSIGGVLYSKDSATLYAYPQAKAGSSLTVDASVTSILPQAFYHQRNLTSLTLPSSALWNNSSNSGWNFFGADNISQVTVNGGNVLDSQTSGAIPDYAFANGINLRKIILTSTIRTIGNGVFVNCPNLEIEIRSNSNFKIEEGVMYNSTGSILICYPSSLTATEYTVIPETSSIRAGAFSMVTSLKKISVGASLIPTNSQGEWSFYGCSSLTDIVITGGGISIPENAFRNARNLKSVSLGETVTRIDANAFLGATSLNRIGCNASLLVSNLNMESWSFYGAANLTHLEIVGGTVLNDYCLYNSQIWEIIIGKSVSEIRGNAFEKAKGLQRITVSADNNYFSSGEDGVLYNKNKTTLIKYPSQNVTDLSGGRFSIPLTVNSISANAFKDSVLLRAVRTPISVLFDNFGRSSWVFYGAEDLNSVTVLNGATIPVGYRYFYNASKLTSVTLSTVTRILEPDLFRGCAILNSVSVASSLLFNNEGNSGYLFYGATSIREVNVISGTSVIDRAFNNATNLNKVSLASTVVTVGANSFAGCTSLETVSAPAALLKNQSASPSWSFYGAARVKNFNVTSGTEIVSGAFSKALFLENVVLSSAITTINGMAFIGTKALLSITFDKNSNIDLEGNVYTYNDNYSTKNGVLFNKTGVTVVLANPLETDESKKDYRNIPTFDSLIAYPANKTGTRYDIPNSVLSIASGAFNSAQKLTVIKLGQNVGTIGAEAFMNCINLEAFESASIKFIVGSNPVDSGILFGTDKKELVAYPMKRAGTTLLLATVNAQDISLSNQAFYSGSDNTAVTTISIRKNALFGANITDIYLSTSVLFDNSANQGWNFYGAQGIKRVYIAEGSAIPAKAFYGANTVEQIYLGFRIESIGADAFVAALPQDVTGLSTYGYKTVYKFVTTNEIYGHFSVDDIGILFEVETSSLVTGTGNYKTLVAYPKYSVTDTLDLSQSKYRYISKVENNAFYGASNLSTLLIPDGMLSERSAAGVWNFYGATEITHITIKKYDASDTTVVPLRAFYNANNLIYVKFETFVERSSNMDTAFYGCASMESLVFDFVSGKTAVYSVDAGVLYESGGTGGTTPKYRLIMYMPSNTANSFVIPSTVKEIANYAFYGTVNLTALTIPNPKDLLYSNAANVNWNYKGSTYITSVTIVKGNASSSDAYIPNEAFMNATRLVKVTVDSSIISVNNNAFYNTPNLEWLTTHIALLDTSLEMGWDFYGATTVSKLTLTKSEGQTVIGANTVDGYVVGNNITITEVEIAEGITGIGDYTFFGAKRLSKVSLPASLTEIGSNAFVDTLLSDIDFSRTSLTTVGIAAFEGNSYITKIILPDTLTEIEERAFSSMTNLSSVYLPEGLQSIGAQAFKGCISLTSIAVPNAVSFIGESAFYGSINTVIYFSEASLPTTLGADWATDTLGYVTSASFYYYSLNNINLEVYAFASAVAVIYPERGEGVFYLNAYPQENIPEIPENNGLIGNWYYDVEGTPTAFTYANHNAKEYLVLYAVWA